jgi:NAD(P)-dependent dehydrogenase (short-subunit alcohol dehydrogenase family)
MRVNVEGTFALTKIVVEQMIARAVTFGRVINVGHVGGLHVLARPKNSAYHLSKTALAVMTRSFADLCGPYAITVNMLNPGVLENSIDFPPDVLEQIPLRRLGTLHDVVSGLSFFVSDESSYVTGAALDISGGYGLRGSP